MFKLFRTLLQPKAEKRSSGTTLSSNFSWLLGNRTSSGVTVSKKNIIGDSAVWAALRILSNAVASLPWEVFEDNGTTRQRLKTHPVDYLINKEPNQLCTSYSFRQAMVWKTYLNGEAYILIHRNKSTAQPYKLELLENSQVDFFEDPELGYYYIIKGTGVNGTIPTYQAVNINDMVHLKAMSQNGISGIDIINAHRENLGVNIAATQYGANFFGNGAHVSSVLETDDELDKEQAERLRAQWSAKYGGINNTGKTAVLEHGLKYKKVGLNPSEAMLVDIRKFQIEEVARIFGIPAHMLSSMDKATFNNIEVMSLDFVKNTLRPLCVMIEQEFNRKLFTEREKRQGNVYTRFNLDSLMRGATKDRFDAYAIAIQNKIMSSNEIRGLENLNPREGGDKFENPMIQVEPNAETVE